MSVIAEQFEKTIAVLKRIPAWAEAEKKIADEELQARQALAKELSQKQTEKKEVIVSLSAEIAIASKEAKDAEIIYTKASRRVSSLQDKLFAVPFELQRQIDILKGRLKKCARPELLARLQQIPEEIEQTRNTPEVSGRNSYFGPQTYSNLSEIRAKIAELNAEEEDIKKQILKGV